VLAPYDFRIEELVCGISHVFGLYGAE
jgi:hypothetical protein